MNFIVIGGKYDDQGGDMSDIAAEAAKTLLNRGAVATLYNGGTYEALCGIFSRIKEYDAAFMWCRVDKDKPRLVTNTPSTILIGLLRKKADEFSYQALHSYMARKKQHLSVAVLTDAEKHKSYAVYDISGNIWYEGTELDACIAAVLNRVRELYSMKKMPSRPNVDIVNIPKVPDENKFFGYIDELTGGVLGDSRVYPSFRKGAIAFMCRRVIDEERVSSECFAPALLNEGRLEYFGKIRPSIDAPMQLRVYELFPNIKYMVHTHSYIKGAPFTNKVFLCGTVDEADVVAAVFKDRTGDFYTVNLLGHGSLVMSSDPDRLSEIEYEERSVPEKIDRRL